MAPKDRFAAKVNAYLFGNLADRLSRRLRRRAKWGRVGRLSDRLHPVLFSRVYARMNRRLYGRRLV